MALRHKCKLLIFDLILSEKSFSIESYKEEYLIDLFIFLNYFSNVDIYFFTLEI